MKRLARNWLKRSGIRRIALATAATIAFGVAGGARGAVDEGRRVLVVYPASATSRIPETIPALSDAARPVAEREELDPETPLGQVRSILGTLSELRTGQKTGLKALSDAVERLEGRLDALGGAVDDATRRLEAVESALARAPEHAPTPEPVVAPPEERARAAESDRAALWRVVALILATVVLCDYFRRNARSSDAASKSAG